MARGPGWFDYLKAAFGFRWPTPWFGALPLNHLCLYAGGVFMALFALAGNLAAALGVLLLTLAYEIVYLYLVSTLPRFRAMVEAETFSRRRRSDAELQQGEARQLEKRSRERYEAMLAVCRQIELELAATVHGGDSWAQALRTGGLAELQSMFLRLLQHRDNLRMHFQSTSARLLPEEIDTLEKQLRGTMAEPVRRSKERTLDILRRRKQNLDHMATSHELADAELQRIEQQLELLREQAVVTDDVGAMVGQIDDVVTGINETSDWLMTSERMLSDPDAELDVSVSA